MERERASGAAAARLVGVEQWFSEHRGIHANDDIARVRTCRTSHDGRGSNSDAARRQKDEDDAIASDATGNTSHDRGYGVGSVGNGDRYFVHFKGTTALKDGAPVSSDCTWKFTGGTGKLNGINGKGTCKGTFRPDGTASWDIKGEYQLAGPAGK